jgi:hypothetical protein
MYINNDYAHKMYMRNVTQDAKVFISVLLTHKKNWPTFNEQQFKQLESFNLK